MHLSCENETKIVKITYCEQAGLSNVGIYIYSVKNLTMKRTKAVAADSVWDIKMQTGKRFAAHASYLLVRSFVVVVSWGTPPPPHRPHRWRTPPPSTLLASTFNLQNLWSLKNKKFMFNLKYDDNNVLPR